MQIKSKGSLGSSGCGCFLLLFVLAAWGICALIFPKMPGYDEAMDSGEVVPGKVLRVEVVENVTINEKHPKKVFYSYGEDREGSMTMAMDESASEGQAIRVRVMGDVAYPEGIRPLAKPSWLNFVLIGAALVASLLIIGGILRLLLIGGVLFASARAGRKGSQPPPSSPPPAPPSSPPPPPPPGPQA